MSVVVFAYHQLGWQCLQVLLERAVRVALVFTHEDDPGEECWFESVAGAARAAGIPTFTPEDPNAPEWRERIRAAAPEAFFSFHYRRLLRPPLLALPRRGGVNLHASLLPRYRGRCPLNWQIIHGEETAGVTLHYMTARADAGDIIDQEAVAVGPDDTALELYHKLVPAAARVLHRNLDGILAGTAPRRKQDESRATAFGGRRPEDGRIDWGRPAAEIHNLVRAVAPPWPGAFTEVADGRLLVRRSKPHSCASPYLEPGEVGSVEGQLFIGTGSGTLEVLDYVAPAGRSLRAGERCGQNQGVPS
jgi:methionyl-tRNA formyltransferase